MPTFRLSIRLLDAAFHGRGDGGEPEWPPSPLRAFQALVNAAARRWREAQFESYARPALQWLEGLGSPAIVAPPGRTATRPYRLYVPNNAGDLMVAAWARGNGDASMAEHRTEKDARPTLFAGPDRRPLGSNPDFLPIHFDWPLTTVEYEEGKTHHLETLKAAAGSITHLGWGVDQAVGHAEMLTADPEANPSTERWLPAGTDDGTPLRVPVAGTLSKLVDKHEAFLNRLSGDGFKPVPPLSAFRVVGYRRATDVAGRPFAAFALLKPDASGFRPFDPARRGAAVAGMVRHAAARAAEAAGWDADRVNSFVLGHGDDKDGQATTDDRLLFLPLPSITPLKVEAVRRVLVAGPPGADLGRIGQLLAGAELVPVGETEPVAMLAVLPRSDKGVVPYVRPARVWTTVTPVVLPGHDDPDGLRQKLRDRPTAEAQKGLLDRLDRRILGLLRRAFEHSGVPPEVAGRLEIEYRGVGFRPGVDLAGRYDLPPLKYPRYHVRVRFPEKVRGPLAVGAGRYRGMGVFAADGD